MKTYKLFMLTLVVALSMFTTGCTESDELTEIIPATEQKEEPTDSTESTSDEFSQALEAIPGVYNVQVDEVIEGDNEEARRYYTFFFNQLIDHNNPSLGYFKQQVRIRISRKGLTAPVVLFTNGYGMSEVNNSYASEMTDYLDASTLWIEHRYFNNSLPEPFESLEFTYLNADQAAQDLHAIVSVMKQTVLVSARMASPQPSMPTIATSTAGTTSTYTCPSVHLSSKAQPKAATTRGWDNISITYVAVAIPPTLRRISPISASARFPWHSSRTRSCATPACVCITRRIPANMSRSSTPSDAMRRWLLPVCYTSSSIVCSISLVMCPSIRGPVWCPTPVM